MSIGKIFKEFGYSGKLLERDYLGEPKIPPGSEAEKLLLSGQKMNNGTYRLPLNKAIALARMIQDPLHPMRPLAQEIFKRIVKKLKLPDDQTQLRFYSAVNTPLDFYWGTDAFFELDVEGEIVRAMIDVTQNPHKEDADDNEKVDYVLHRLPDERMDPYLYGEALQETVSDITKILVHKRDAVIKLKSQPQVN